MSTQIKNVFVSHVHEDDALLGSFKQLLANKGYDIRDGSINSDKPNDANNENYIKSEILAPRLQWAGVVIVLITPNTHKSTWVNWEIEYAQKKDKRIIGVWAQGAKESDLPPALNMYNDGLVGWNADAIISAINGGGDSTSPDGSPSQEKVIVRYNC